MRYSTVAFFISYFLVACSGHLVTEPNPGANLLTNSDFQKNGKPSLNGWIVPDTSAIHFSADTPANGSGTSIFMHAEWYAPWPSNSIYTTILPPEGKHRYKLSVFGKKTGVGGSVSVYLHRPSTSRSSIVSTLQIGPDSTWTSYSQEDTISATLSDTLFLIIHGGGTELLTGTTYFNTCTFELVE